MKWTLPCWDLYPASLQKLASENVSTPMWSQSIHLAGKTSFTSLIVDWAIVTTRLASFNVSTVAPFTDVCNLETRYWISGLPWRATHDRDPITDLSCVKSSCFKGSVALRPSLILIFLILRVLSATSMVTSPYLSCVNCFPQYLKFPFSALPISNRLSNFSTTWFPSGKLENNKSSTWVVNTATVFFFSFKQK